jgi:alkanesulfonate monooxygenase SsuD/methylene tetrahydromethanopterin reductase-like flavin-dependent oxidoreductase (luciferase family)
MAAGRDRLRSELAAAGRDADGFSIALSTMWTYVTGNASEKQRRLESIAKMLNRPVESVAEQVLIGPPDECAAKLRAYRDIGVRVLFIWPIGDGVAQLQRLQREVAPLV